MQHLIINKYIQQLKDEVLITAANTASCKWKIARYKPEFRSLITDNLIQVDLVDRDDECKAIMAGKAIQSLEEYWPLIDKKEEVMEFVNRHIDSQRSGTSKKAKKFIEQHQKDLL